ncbi:MAG: hypothetical protein KAR13_11920 [Desulfobulbaceae bacterium]|nr:hypothetical protein [Desulfobulbaceae bacterium]
MSKPTPETFNMIRWIIPVTFPAISGLVGVLIGAWLSNRQHRKKQKLEFLEKQISYFYSPLLGIRDEIRMLSELRQKISQSADRHRKKMCADAMESGGPEYVEKLTSERRDDFMKSIEYDNRQLTESLLPSYRKMASIFRDNYYLAENRTRNFFRVLLEFIDIWDRWLDKSIPHEVVEELAHGENPLQPFYEDLEKTHDELRTKLSNVDV